MKSDNSLRMKLVQNKKLLAIGISSLVLAAVALFLVFRTGLQKEPELISLSQLAQDIATGRVTRIEDAVYGGELTIFYRNGKAEKGMRDPSASLLEQLSLLGVKQDQLSDVQFTFITPTNAANSPLNALLLFGLVGGGVLAYMRLNKGEKWGRKTYEEAEIPSLKFQDVAGLEDNLQELRDVVTFLTEGNKYADMGAKMPRGVLMVGDPGTGKTLIAKAVAGEANVPFFATSGSEFNEVFVGVGASRIRALFKKARKKAPCIIFIDEIDAVGRARHRSESGAEMEQDQTLNQLLVEMDGFTSADGVVVLAATNRVDILDAALTRAGRFDRRVYVGRPDLKGREQILGVHVSGKKLAEEVSLTQLAKATPGLVGADLANIVNEAAINAVRNQHPAITMKDFNEAIEKHIAGGVPRKSQVMAQDERQIVAFHEAGHAVVIHETEQSDPVVKISIIPRGQMGGYTMSIPEQDSNLISRGKLLSRITGLLGGRAAEEIFFNDVTSGASNDLKVATQLAEEMVMRLGMDQRTGLRVFEQGGQSSSVVSLQGSQKTFETIDETVRSILDECYAEARRILLEKRLQVEKVAQALLEVETIDQEQFFALMRPEINLN